MYPVRMVQIPDKSTCVSLHTNAFLKDMDLFLPY